MKSYIIPEIFPTYPVANEKVFIKTCACVEEYMSYAYTQHAAKPNTRKPHVACTGYRELRTNIESYSVTVEKANIKSS